jgi:hypothetical protein
MENIAPQLLQAAGRQCDVILQRKSGQLCDKSNQNSGLHEEGIL